MSMLVQKSQDHKKAKDHKMMIRDYAWLMILRSSRSHSCQIYIWRRWDAQVDRHDVLTELFLCRDIKNKIMQRQSTMAKLHISNPMLRNLGSQLWLFHDCLEGLSKDDFGPWNELCGERIKDAHKRERLEEYNSHPQKTIHNFKMSLQKQKLQLQTATQIMLAHFCFAAAADSVLGRIRAKTHVDEQVAPKVEYPSDEEWHEDINNNDRVLLKVIAAINFQIVLADTQYAEEDGEKKEDSMDTELPVIEKWLHYLIYIMEEDARILILLHAYHDSTTSLSTPLIMIVVSTRSSGVFWKLVSRKGLQVG
ncbi:hypothetical protein Tco_0996121 [Tanacetum coccineum]